MIAMMMMIHQQLSSSKKLQHIVLTSLSENQLWRKLLVWKAAEPFRPLSRPYYAFAPQCVPWKVRAHPPDRKGIYHGQKTV